MIKNIDYKCTDGKIIHIDCQQVNLFNLGTKQDASVFFYKTIKSATERDLENVLYWKLEASGYGYFAFDDIGSSNADIELVKKAIKLANISLNKQGSNLVLKFDKDYNEYKCYRHVDNNLIPIDYNDMTIPEYLYLECLFTAVLECDNDILCISNIIDLLHVSDTHVNDMYIRLITDILSVKPNMQLFMNTFNLPYIIYLKLEDSHYKGHVCQTLNLSKIIN